MISFILSTSETIAKISDLISGKWAEILGWISIPTVATALLVCVFKLITAAVSKKIASKNVKPLADKVEEAKTSLLSTVGEVEKLFNEKLQEYSVLVENKFNDCFTKYSQAKQAAFAKIVEGEETVKEIIKDVEQSKVVIESIANEISQNDIIPEEVAEPVIEPPKQTEKKNSKKKDESDWLLR